MQPRESKVYPIPCDEWGFLKNKIAGLASEPWFFQGLAWLLIGSGVTTGISIVLGAIDSTKPTNIIIAWAVTIVTAVCGVLCLLFAWLRKGDKRTLASEVAAQMEIIENRFVPDNNTRKVPDITNHSFFVRPTSEQLAMMQARGRGVEHNTFTKPDNPGNPANNEPSWQEKVKSLLSEEAKQMLIQATKDKTGVITKAVTFEGTSIHAGGKTFCNTPERREITRWEQGIIQLLSNRLIEEQSKGQIYAVTKRGYGLVDYMISET